ncbi:MAG: phosphatase PAP2 family protein [Candidatus Heimdallarchaeota archaeon]|nr:phosphatase PAP2 family protein [Candidatus Heimdallarchaeota archaeon]
MNLYLRIKKSFLAKYSLIIIIIWIVLAIVFGLYDLQISQTFVNYNSLWGEFGSKVGEAPGYALIAVSLAILIGSLFDRVEFQKIIPFISAAAVCGLAIYGIVTQKERMIILGCCIGFSLFLVSIITFKKDWKNYRKFAGVIALLAIINPLIFVQLFKLLCGRIRYRDLDPGFEDYTPWYLPPGPTSLGNSFPSGHTAMGWMLLPLLILAKDRKITDPRKLALITVVFLWGIFVALSRIRKGAHFASDTLFSTGVAFLAFILLYNLFYKKNGKTRSEEYQIEDELK